MSIEVMRTGRVKPLVDRVYRESGNYQWVRETYINAIQALARRILFSIEWSAVATRGVYRRLIADDGAGMTPEQLVAFINVFGGGGRPIGGEHENYGVGSKSSLLPWNQAGIVMLSLCNGVSSMIRLRYDPESDEYGLHVFEVEDAGNPIMTNVVVPYDDRTGETGVDWTSVMPQWIHDAGHGTVIVLLGNDLDEDTVLGAPDRSEDTTKGLLRYLNSRSWELPEGLDVTVDVLPKEDKKHWPSQPVNLGRKVHGARHYIEWTTRGSVAASGSTPLPNGVVAHWWLRDGTPLNLDYAPNKGYIAALYNNELYDVSNHHQVYRAAGVVSADIRNRLWLVFEPPLAVDGGDGVYPNTSRNGLLIRDASGLRSGERVPLAEWCDMWAEAMPAEVRAAIAAAMQAQTESGDVPESLRRRIAARFGSRWKIPRLKVRNGGGLTVTPTMAGSTPRTTPTCNHGSGGRPGGLGGRSGPTAIGITPGPQPATSAMVQGALPSWASCTADDVGEPWILATYAATGGQNGEPTVFINAEHPVMTEQIRYYQDRYQPSVSEEVASEVLGFYGLMAATKVAHSESLRAIASPSVVADLQSDSALTTGLLGLYVEDQTLGQMLATRFGRARSGN